MPHKLGLQLLLDRGRCFQWEYLMMYNIFGEFHLGNLNRKHQLVKLYDFICTCKILIDRKSKLFILLAIKDKQVLIGRHANENGHHIILLVFTLDK